MEMSDMEKTIKEMNALRNWLLRMEEFNDHGNGDMYHEFGCTVYSALELLREQEAVKPKLVDVNTWTCGKCGALLGWEEFSQFGLELVKYKYCPECGRLVRWE